MRLSSAGAVFLALALLCGAGTHAAETSPVGRWWTFDGDTGAKSGIIEITLAHDELVGRIVKMIPRPGDPPDPVCDRCDGPERDQRVLGMTILKGLKHDGDMWIGGTILDPRTGYVYGVQLHPDESGKKLFVRGYLGISLLGRTQTWLRAE
jgi:hypothetical protein